MINQEKHSAMKYISQRINKHCLDIKKIADALVEAMLKTVIMNLVKTYESIRNDVEKISYSKNADFNNMFPKLDVNFETYYTIAISLLNLIYQLQYMKIYCQTL